jgi:hypothetical protein
MDGASLLDRAVKEAGVAFVRARPSSTTTAAAIRCASAIRSPPSEIAEGIARLAKLI